MSKLKNKVAVVTGASKGIGASIAKHFADEGAKIVVNYASSKEAADKVVKAITDSGGIAISVQADVSKEADVIRLFEETKMAFGTLDILVNNAAFQGYTPIEQVTTESFHQHFNVNVLGALLAIQASLILFGDKGGNIINISSGSSKMPLPTASLYSATKAALDAITISLSKELGAKNIRVNSILLALRKQKVHVVRALLLAVSMKKCLLPIHPLVVEVSPKILQKLQYFLLPMMQLGLLVSKFPFRVVCMVFKFINSKNERQWEGIID
jgi:3-oxoacyl-[acyl-carrier protein] reductase